MLHRIVMVGLVVAGLVVAGLGVASATVWRPSDTAVMTTGEVSAPAGASATTLLTTAPGVLSLVDDDVTVTARSSDDATVVLALGSQVDVEGWVGDDPSRVVTGASDWETLTVEDAVATTDDDAEPTDATTDAATEDETADAETADEPAAPGPDPTGSDMWVESTSGTGSVSLDWVAKSTDQVLLVAAVGEDAAAPQLTLSWPREVTTPLLWPGVALGVLLVLAGLVYGLLTGRRRRRSAAPVPGRAARPATPGAPQAAGTLTRRQLREQAEREQQETADPAPRPKRQWPWTGAVPVVAPSDVQAGTDDAASASETAAEAHRPAWLPEGTASTSGSSWRAAWGVRTPDATTSTDDEPSDARPAPTSAHPSPHAGTVASPAASPSQETPASQTAPAAAPAPSGQAGGTEPSARPLAKPGAQVPPARPVDQTSPFQRITLRSGDESAPARRIRRDQQPQQPSAWSAPRSPWARPARPPVEPGAPDEPTPAPTDDTSKDTE